MKRVFVALLPFFLISLVQAKGEADYHSKIRDYQKILRLSPNANKGELKSDLDRHGFKVLAEGKSFLVIIPKVEMNRFAFRNKLSFLSRREDIVEVKDDKVRIKQQQEVTNLHDCPQMQVGPVINAYTGINADVYDAVSEVTNPGCQLFPSCSNGDNPAWARMQIGADMADEIVEDVLGELPEERRAESAARIAVVDSGFDQQNQEGGLDVLSLDIEMGHDSSGRANIDPDGHGTAVSGMIGAEGIGVSRFVHLDVYRVTEEHALGSTSNGLLAAAIERACQGSDIVNVSWGSLAHEWGLTDVDDQEWYDEAQRQGCLVVQSSGNSGYRRNEFEAPPIDSPYLTVAATNELAVDASFSTVGMITAPGEGVYTLLSHNHEYRDSTIRNACRYNGHVIGPINGTSFASPALAGVAGQVISVLRAKGTLPENPRKKLALIKSILLASTNWNAQVGRNPTQVNALAATKIATNLTTELIDSTVETNMMNRIGVIQSLTGSSVYSFDLDRLVEIGQSGLGDTCEEQNESCLFPADCESKKDCISSLRYQTMLCVPPSREQQNQLFELLTDLGEDELRLDLITRDQLGGEGNPEDLSLINETLVEEWDELASNSFNLDLHRAVDLMQIAARNADQDQASSFITEERLVRMIQSYDFSSVFSVNIISDSDLLTENESLRTDFVNVFKRLTPEEQIRIIQGIPNHSDYLEGQLGLVYSLFQSKDDLPEDVQAALQRKIEELAGLWLDGSLVTARSNNLTLTRNAPVIDFLLENTPGGADRLFQMLSQGQEVNEENLFLFSYAVNSDDLISERQKSEIARQVLNQLDHETDETYLYLVNDSIEHLMRRGASEEEVRDALDVFRTSRLASLRSVELRHHDLAEHPVFWHGFVEMQTMTINRYFNQNPRGTYTTRPIPLDNLEEVLTSDLDLGDDARREIFSGIRTPLSQALRTSIERRIEYRNFDLGDYGPERDLRTYSDDTLDLILDNFDEWEEVGLGDQFRTDLRVLMDDINRHPSDYPQNLRIRVARALNLSE